MLYSQILSFPTPSSAVAPKWLVQHSRKTGQRRWLPTSPQRKVRSSAMVAKWRDSGSMDAEAFSWVLSDRLRVYLHNRPYSCVHVHFKVQSKWQNFSLVLVQQLFSLLCFFSEAVINRSVMISCIPYISFLPILFIYYDQDNVHTKLSRHPQIVLAITLDSSKHISMKHRS